ERSDAEKNIHNNGASRSDEHGPFSAETICEKAIYDQTAGIGEQGRCDDVAHLRFAEPEFAADCAIREREIITAHVERGVEQADQGPIQSAPWAKSRRMRRKNRSIRRVGHSRRMRECEPPTQREINFVRRRFGSSSVRHCWRPVAAPCLRNPNRLCIDELANSCRAKLAAKTRTLHTSERQTWIRCDHRVDENHSSFQF